MGKNLTPLVAGLIVDRAKRNQEEGKGKNIFRFYLEEKETIKERERREIGLKKKSKKGIFE